MIRVDAQHRTNTAILATKMLYRVCLTAWRIAQEKGKKKGSQEPGTGGV